MGLDIFLEDTPYTLNTAPVDFRERIMAIDSITLNASDPDYFDVGMSKITKRLGKLSVAPAAQAPARKPHAGVLAPRLSNP